MQALLSDRPEYNEKIKAGFLMAPVGYVTAAKSLKFLLSPFIDTIRSLVENTGRYEWFVHLKLYSLFGHIFCDEDKHPIFTKEICDFVANDLVGFSEGQLNQ